MVAPLIALGAVATILSILVTIAPLLERLLKFVFKYGSRLTSSASKDFKNNLEILSKMKTKYLENGKPPNMSDIPNVVKDIVKDLGEINFQNVKDFVVSLHEIFVDDEARKALQDVTELGNSAAHVEEVISAIQTKDKTRIKNLSLKLKNESKLNLGVSVLKAKGSVKQLNYKKKTRIKKATRSIKNKLKSILKKKGKKPEQYRSPYY